MNRLLKLDKENRVALVEPGLVNGELNRLVSKEGLFFAPDPSSQSVCTLGGNLAENAGGIHCVKYGVTTDHVLGLEWITGAGIRLALGSPTLHSPAPLICSLLTGSEGTLGVATKLWVRLLPKPSQRKVYLASFSSIASAAKAVSSLTSSGILPSALEFMDRLTVQCVNQRYQVGFPEESEAVLLIELDNVEEDLPYLSHQLETVLSSFCPLQVRKSSTEQEAEELWQARRGAAPSFGVMAPAFYVLDCVIPRSQLVQVLQQIQAVGEQFELKIGNVFHAGDGNLHPHLLFNPMDTAQTERVKAAAELIVSCCLNAGGTLSGEHGIGLEKRGWMTKVFSQSELDRMQAIRKVFDPKHLANPDKVFPLRRACGEAGIQSASEQLKGWKAKELEASPMWI
jgi:glycolate oxidase subunit GlcD